MALGFKKKSTPDDFGFGEKAAQNDERLVNADGSFNVLRRGGFVFAPYMSLIETNWWIFSLAVFLFCVSINSIFAFCFMAIGIEHLTGQPSVSLLQDFSDAFFFSVQTFTTVGYGALHPEGIIANIIAALDALIGLLSFALATGLFFGRVSKPKPQILYSDQAVIRPFKGERAFMFRVVNGRSHKLINLKANVILSWREEDGESGKRRYYTFKLERDKATFLPLSWTLVNIFDEEHPLYGKSWDEIKAMNIEVVIQMEAYDQTYNQLVYSNHSYTTENILWDRKFIIMFEATGEKTILHLDMLSATEAVGDGD